VTELLEHVQARATVNNFYA